MKYKITSTNIEGEFIVEYDAKGVMRTFTNNARMANDALHFLATHFPLGEPWLEKFKVQFDCNIQLINENITFEMFYDKYGLKEGKAKALSSWDKLTALERNDAYNYIPKYNTQLSQAAWRGKLMPATYLNQKRWLD